MRVFISWSGAQSRSYALALSAWLPKVLQGVKCFVSAKDIDKGANWVYELSRELEAADFGIVCLTPINLRSPWLNYEAGAITTSVNSRVCPVLFGGVTKAQVEPPLNQLQLTDFNQVDIAQLVHSMNKVAGGGVPERDVDEIVNTWWAKLELAVSCVEPTDEVATQSKEPPSPRPDDHELIREVLRIVRRLEQHMDDDHDNDHGHDDEEYFRFYEEDVTDKGYPDPRPRPMPLPRG